MVAETKIYKTIDKLKKIARDSIRKGDYNKSMAAITSGADILYNYNQYYVDQDFEDMIMDLSNILINKDTEYKTNKDTVLFYDGFGLDTRGIAINITQAIARNNYRLIYVTNKSRMNKQKNLINELSKYNVEFEYIDTDIDYCTIVNQLNTIFYKYYPKFAFYYTYPSDIPGAIVFDALEGKLTRMQVDLTDHAFWIGINAFDYISSGREYSASVQMYYRNIPLDKLIYVDLAGLPYVSHIEFQGLPFEENKKFIFSGGALYKTLGDESNTYYRIIDRILENNKGICFYYAGAGDTSQLDLIRNKYPDRVYYSQERKDFYEVIKRCLFYLNTYPMFGGMMMRYAALAGKLPLTLRHNDEASGLLFNQETRQIEYDDMEEMISDIDIIIQDDDYRKMRENKLKGSVFSEDEFANIIKTIIEEKKSNIIFDFTNVPKVDTRQFLQEYKQRFKFLIICNAVCRKKNTSIITAFPVEFLIGLIIKLSKRIGNQ